jgi:hypothetical protein
MSISETQNIYHKIYFQKIKTPKCPECREKATPKIVNGELIFVFEKHKPNCKLFKMGKEITKELNQLLRSGKNE